MNPNLNDHSWEMKHKSENKIKILNTKTNKLHISLSIPDLNLGKGQVHRVSVSIQLHP